MLGVSGLSSALRDYLNKKAAKGNKRAELALEVFGESDS